MTELERRALLGDKQAQEECTRNGIALCCPICYAKISVSKAGHLFHCKLCNFTLTYPAKISKAETLERWNTRHEPPIGRCKDCENTCPGEDGSYLVCVIHGHAVNNDDWCGKFEQRKPRCKDCANWRGDELDAYAPCSDCDGVMEAENCCKNFEPKEE